MLTQRNQKIECKVPLPVDGGDTGVQFGRLVAFLYTARCAWAN